MTRVRIGTTVWETGAPPFLPLGRARTSDGRGLGPDGRRPRGHGTLALTTIVSTPKAEQAKDDVVVAERDSRRMRSGSSPGRRRLPRPPPAASPAIDRRSPAHLFVAELSGEAARFVSPAEPVAETGRFAPWNPVSAAPEWREEEFGQVGVVDGRTLQAGPVRIQLIGLDLPMGEQVCRTLDGRFEPCATRAATQLELLTRHRKHHLPLPLGARRGGDRPLPRRHERSHGTHGPDGLCLAFGGAACRASPLKLPAKRLTASVSTYPLKPALVGTSGADTAQRRQGDARKRLNTRSGALVLCREGTRRPGPDVRRLGAPESHDRLLAPARRVRPPARRSGRRRR